MKTATWADCRADFVVDGALVDLLVPGSGPAEWEAFWTTLRAGPFQLRAYRDHAPIPLPESAAWMLAENNVASVMLSVQAGAITANCHFYSRDLRLDIDPREVTDEAAFESVLVLVRFIAVALRLAVLASPAGCGPEFAFLRVSPDGEATFLPPE